jgi:hypothetical protein
MYEVIPKEDRQGKYADPILTEDEKKVGEKGSTSYRPMIWKTTLLQSSVLSKF